MEKTTFIDGTDEIDFTNKKITENTRVGYQLCLIANATYPSVGSVPKNIFLLSADAYGILPPISKLTPGQAMCHFISGYTAKIAGN